MGHQVLPDSRLADRQYKSVMIDWPVYSFGDDGNPLGGVLVKVLCTPCYCIWCGVDTGLYVPEENTASVQVCCDRCAREKGAPGAEYVPSDYQFQQDVTYELTELVGHNPTGDEINHLAALGRLDTPALSALARESPYNIWTPPS